MIESPVNFWIGVAVDLAAGDFVLAGASRSKEEAERMAQERTDQDHYVRAFNLDPSQSIKVIADELANWFTWLKIPSCDHGQLIRDFGRALMSLFPERKNRKRVKG